MWDAGAGSFVRQPTRSRMFILRMSAFLNTLYTASSTAKTSMNEYLVLRLSETVVLRVQPEGVEMEDQGIRFKIGDRVRVKATAERTMRHGVVRLIDYHEKLGCPIFFIREGGREVKGRYFEQELESDPE